MPLVQTRGAASAQGFGEFAQATAVNYIEDVFSTYLYTGTGAALTITNNIDLSTKGGLVWCKERGTISDHVLTDSTSSSSYLRSNGTNALVAGGDITGFTSSGFTLANNTGDVDVNNSTNVSWTFRKQPKFFDIVTWSGSGINTTIPHSLGVVPGCIIVKRTDTTAAWAVYHRSLANTQYLVLNTTDAAATGATWWNSTTPTSAVFSVGTDATVNASGGTYIAYLFAHDAGGFGLTGTDNVISCGSYTGNGNNTITLGYEPQWVMARRTNTAGNDWEIYDTMRGMALTSSSVLNANTTGAEGVGGTIYPTATGFYNSSYGSGNIIYIAIRRGPMKVPTLGTSVFSPNAYAGAGAGTTYTTNFPVDMTFVKARNAVTQTEAWDRLRGGSQYLLTDVTDAEANFGSIQWQADRMTSIKWNSGDGYSNSSGRDFVTWNFKRAPSFFDEVCYTGTGANTTQSHNLGAVPEMIIVKSRSAATEAEIYVAPLGNDSAINLFGASGGAFTTGGIAWNYTTPTASVFSLGTWNKVNGSGVTFVAWIFATCPGVSKVGSYAGNGTTQTIDCGFTGGARFVLIKRTDTSGSWYTYDTARGMTVLTDPYLELNSTAAEVATLGSVTTVSTGFALDSSILAAINVNAGTYIFFAVS